MESKDFEPIYLCLHVPKNSVQSAIFEAKREWKKAIAIAADLERCDDVMEAASHLRRVILEAELLKKEGFL